MNELVIGKLLKDKLMKSGGEATFPMIRKPTTIFFYNYEYGIMFEKIGSVAFPFELFDDVVKEANKLGGIMYCADSPARNGEKLGSANLPLTVIDAFVAYKHFDKKKGNTILGCGTYIASTLRWLGVADYISDASGRYIKIKKEYGYL